MLGGAPGVVLRFLFPVIVPVVDQVNRLGVKERKRKSDKERKVEHGKHTCCISKEVSSSDDVPLSAVGSRQFSCFSWIPNNFCRPKNAAADKVVDKRARSSLGQPE